LKRGQVWCDLPGQVDAEALHGHRMAVLEPGVADPGLVDARPLREQPGHEGGVHPALLDRQQQVFPGAAGRERVDLVDAEVIGRRTETRRQHCRAMGVRPGRLAGCGHAACACSRHTACAAMPSPRPVKPSVSVVVALTLITSSPTPSAAAMAARIAATCGPTRGCSQTMVMSALPSCQPRSRTSVATRRSNTSPA